MAQADPSLAVLDHCMVSLIDNVDVPAQEPGQLIAVEAKEGLEIEAGTHLATIDDRQPQVQKRLAQVEYKRALRTVENDVDVRYAKAALEVADVEYLQSIEANRKVTGAVPEIEVRRLWLTRRRAGLQIEQAEFQTELADLDVHARQAEVDAAELGIERRQIQAPVGGVVVEVYRRRGEWVNPGDPVLRIVRMDRLRIEGFVNSKNYNPNEISGRPVTVEVQLARGQTEMFQGKIVFVSPLVEAGGDYRVWAEVENRPRDNVWVMRPGLQAKMIVHLANDVNVQAQRQRPFELPR